MKTLGIIVARGGSKGVPRKNIRPFYGKPLIAWTIESALGASMLDKVIVSTDDKEIAECARGFGADVPFLRPASLATDDAKSIDVVIHAVELFPQYDSILLLQPTSPFRNAIDIDSIIQLSIDHNSSSAVSVCPVNCPPEWMYFLSNDLNIIPVSKNKPIFRRQDMSPTYELNGALYFSDRTSLIKNQGFISEETLGYIMPPERSIDIDTELDWKIGECIMRDLIG